ncbi:M20/M25/M40 family metallo-hydrolase, partial [Streptomyces spiramenti]
RYTVTRPATHPSNPEPKASELAAACWNTLLELLGPNAGHSTFDQPGATLSRLTADLTSATADMSIRLPPDFDTRTLLQRLRTRLPAGTLDIQNNVPACRVDRTDPVVRALTTGIRQHHTQPRLKVKTATSDMNTLAEVWNIPMATYGPGDSSLDHTDHEHIVLSEYQHSIDILTQAIHQLARLPSHPDNSPTDTTPPHPRSRR